MHRGRPVPTDLAVYVVYRSRNAPLVRQYLDELREGDQVALHRLDVCSDEPVTGTISTGPGPRMLLLQGLLDARPPRAGQGVVILDDDVAGDPGWLHRFVGLAVAAGFDLAQPTHSIGSNHNIRLNRSRAGSTARLTSFVEVGPVVYLSPTAQEMLLPFPEDAGMGWGLDVRWSTYRARGLLLGVIDAVAVRHLGTVGSEYDVTSEGARLHDELDLLGDDEQGAWARDLAEPWRPWRSTPPWHDVRGRLDDTKETHRGLP